MFNNMMADEFYRRFKDYKNPSQMQKDFLALYKAKDNLDELQTKRIVALMKALTTIDKHAKEKRTLSKLAKEVNKQEVKDDNRAKIIIGGAIAKGTLLQTRVYQQVIDMMIKDKMINEDDSVIVQKYLSKIKKKDEEKKSSSNIQIG